MIGKETTANIRIAAYSEELRDAHREFARRMWPKKRRRSEEALIRWKFRGPKTGEVRGLLLAVEEDGSVVGELGLIPARLRVGGSTLNCQWACELMVDPKKRRMGIASRLFDAAMKRGVVTLGSSPSPAAEVTMRRLGFQIAMGPWTMVMPLQASYVIRWKLPERWTELAPALGLLAEPVTRVLRWRLWFCRSRGAAASTWKDLRGLVEETERGLDRPHIVHDEAFLRWRCEGLDGFNPSLKAWACGKAYAFTGRSGASMRIYDWVAKDEASCRALIRRAYEEACEAGAATIVTHAQTEVEKTWLMRLGFLPMRRRVPILYHPGDLIPAGSGFRYAYYDSDGDI